MSQKNQNKKPTFKDILKKSDEIAFPIIGIDVANMKDCSALAVGEIKRDDNILQNIKEAGKKFDKQWACNSSKTLEEYEEQRKNRLFNEPPHGDDIHSKTYTHTPLGTIEIVEKDIVPKDTILFVGPGAKMQILNMVEFPEEYRKYIGIIILLTGWKRFWYSVKMFFIRIKWAIERFNKYIKEAYLP